MSNIQIKTLEGLSLSTVTATFNEAFAHYFIPLQFTEEGMAAKMKSEGINLSYSIGAFDGERLVGFMLHAYDRVNAIPTIYNAGTGVVPGYRGKGLTTAMYQYAIPYLNKEGITRHMLEVIDSNKPAIKIYEAAGFIKQRNLAAYKSSGALATVTNIPIQSIDRIPADKAFHIVKPSWQNSTASIERDKEGHQLIGAFENGVLVGYLAFVLPSARIKQLGVHEDHQRKGVGSALLAHVYKSCNDQPIMITNVDESSTAVVNFLEALKFKKVLGLYEMRLDVSL